MILQTCHQNDRDGLLFYTDIEDIGILSFPFSVLYTVGGTGQWLYLVQTKNQKHFLPFFFHGATTTEEL